jgi:hypothetical protein
MPLNPTTNREIQDFICMKYRYTDDGEGAEYRVVAGYYAQLFDIYDAGLVTNDEELDHMLANRRWEVEAYAHEKGWTIDRDFTYPEQSKANRFNLVSAPKESYTRDEWHTSTH